MHHLFVVNADKNSPTGKVSIPTVTKPTLQGCKSGVLKALVTYEHNQGLCA
ncbi:hypothetical protein LMG28614_04111 [Paraburkholderia ultramafica]|uniref:Uncharacterized protein n=1 Tax=Paraburkholderia ultramafica TaxID=1544867 RepID=A0A6S7BUR5_9BURK|nr:hypothetical protein LMG28614_04111 [Paraburkholderia ultramafica]